MAETPFNKDSDDLQAIMESSLQELEENNVGTSVEDSSGQQMMVLPNFPTSEDGSVEPIYYLILDEEYGTIKAATASQLNDGNNIILNSLAAANVISTVPQNMVMNNVSITELPSENYETLTSATNTFDANSEFIANLVSGPSSHSSQILPAPATTTSVEESSSNIVEEQINKETENICKPQTKFIIVQQEKVPSSSSENISNSSGNGNIHSELESLIESATTANFEPISYNNSQQQKQILIPSTTTTNNDAENKKVEINKSEQQSKQTTIIFKPSFERINNNNIIAVKSEKTAHIPAILKNRSLSFSSKQANINNNSNNIEKVTIKIENVEKAASLAPAVNNIKIENVEKVVNGINKVNESSTEDDDKKVPKIIIKEKDVISFCCSCGCFGLEKEFFEEIYCTTSCAYSHKRATQLEQKEKLSLLGNHAKKLTNQQKTNIINSIGKTKSSPIFRGKIENISDSENSQIIGNPKKIFNSSGKFKGNLTSTISPLELKLEVNSPNFTSPSPSPPLRNSNNRKKKGAASVSKKIQERKRSIEQFYNSRKMPHVESPERKSTESGGSDMGTPPGRKNTPDFDWQKYLGESKSKGAPSRLFRQPALPSENPFKIGMVLEAIDPVHPSHFCAVIIQDIQGYRLRLRFIGYPEIYDFWVNADSDEIFPCGWCQDNGIDLQPPNGENNSFNWHKYMVEKRLQVAPRHFFSISKDEPILESSGIKVDMKLEAVDIKNQSTNHCVATVARVVGEKFLVHFDSWDDSYGNKNYWTDPTSQNIHPVGWCLKNDIPLTPPVSSVPNEEKKDFTWEKYLKQTKCVPVPEKFFRPLPPVGFKKGLKLECVDRRNPFLVRVATIADVKGHNILIHFDGWPEMYDYEIEETSTDIHPPGWCQHTGHSLQPPPSHEKNGNGICPTFGCLGLGHIKGPKFLTHNTDKNCPYSTVNYKREIKLPSRLSLYYEKTSPLDKNKKDRLEYFDPAIKPAISPPFNPTLKKAKRKKKLISKKHEIVNIKKSEISSQSLKQNGSSQLNRVLFPPQKTSFQSNPYFSNPDAFFQQNDDFPLENDIYPSKRTRYFGGHFSVSYWTSPDEIDTTFAPFFDKNAEDDLKEIVGDLNVETVDNWTVEEVSEFVDKVTGCKNISTLFLESMICGSSFLLLSESDCVNALGLKVGPTLKIINTIRFIRSQSIKMVFNTV